jgi:pimeloyl-ACP methyl ester carboxylesterase
MQVKDPSFVTVDGRRMAFDEVTPAEPRGVVLLLTGLASYRLGWWNQLPVFGRSYRTIALDHRETGDSDLTGQPYTADDMADDAAGVLDALSIHRANIIGISLGGNVTLRLALRRPDLVDKLVLTSTFAGGTSYVAPSPEMLSLLARPGWDLEPGERRRQTYNAITGPGFAQAHPAVMDYIAQLGQHRTMSPDAYMRQLQASSAAPDISGQLDRITAPTLVIHGDADPLIPIANGRYLAEHIPGARSIIYPGVGHVPILECPDKYNRDVLTFLDGQRVT